MGVNKVWNIYKAYKAKKPLKGGIKPISSVKPSVPKNKIESLSRDMKNFSRSMAAKTKKLQDDSWHFKKEVKELTKKIKDIEK